MALESELITKACYHIAIAKQYLEGFKLETRQQAKYQASLWVRQVEQVEKSIYLSLTPESKILFNKEILEGDLLFLPNMSELILKMNNEQRELIERLAEGILKGEIIEYFKK